MGVYRTANEEVAYLEEQQERLKQKLLVAKTNAREQALKDRNNRLISAATRIEEIVHNEGFTDWELSYPKTSGRTYRDLDDTATMIGLFVLTALKSGNNLKSETSWQKQQRKA